jgi:hypothetical protein
MAAMLVPLPETSSDSNTLVLGHYPASGDPMTNIGSHPFENVIPQNHPFRRAAVISRLAPLTQVMQVTCSHMAISGMLATLSEFRRTFDRRPTDVRAAKKRPLP